MNSSGLQLLDPISRQPLRWTAVESSLGFGYWAYADGGRRWPAALGIAYLRADREALAEAVVAHILAGDFPQALGMLLQDTDDFAPVVPELAVCGEMAKRLLANDVSLSGRELMEALGYGPVADYFALRGSAPTFFSGLGLLKLGAGKERTVIEVGCGAGHFVHWLRARGVEAVGTDSVFSKLCLAHRFLSVGAEKLVCAVAGKGQGVPIETAQATTVFCHDAFYFIKERGDTLLRGRVQRVLKD